MLSRKGIVFATPSGATSITVLPGSQLVVNEQAEIVFGKTKSPIGSNGYFVRVAISARLTIASRASPPVLQAAIEPDRSRTSKVSPDPMGTSALGSLGTSGAPI